MLISKKLKLAKLDKVILKHLLTSSWYQLRKNENSSFSPNLKFDQIDLTESWVTLVREFITIVWSDKAWKGPAMVAGLNEQDLIDIYLLMIIGTMPKPFCKTGRNKLSFNLVASMVFQEINKFYKPLLDSCIAPSTKEEIEVLGGHKYGPAAILWSGQIQLSHLQAYGKLSVDEVFEIVNL